MIGARGEFFILRHLGLARLAFKQRVRARRPATPVRGLPAVADLLRRDFAERDEAAAAGKWKEGSGVRRFIVMGIVTVASLCMFAGPAVAQHGGKVLLIIRDAKVAEPAYLDWMITKEAGVMKETLQKAGYQVEAASPTGEPWGTPGHTLKIDRKLKDVNVADYKAIVIPCMAIDSDALHPDLDVVIKAAVKQGTPVAAQNGGVVMLGKAGALAGKRYAVSDEGAKEITGGTRTGTGVVKDGQIITSGICPAMAREVKRTEDGTPKLMEMLIAELKQAK